MAAMVQVSLQKRMTKLAGGCPGGYGSAEEEDEKKNSSGGGGGGVTLQKRMTKLAGGCPGYGSGENETDDETNKNDNSTATEHKQPPLSDEEEKEEVSKLVDIMT